MSDFEGSYSVVQGDGTQAAPASTHVGVASTVHQVMVALQAHPFEYTDDFKEGVEDGVRSLGVKEIRTISFLDVAIATVTRMN